MYEKTEKFNNKGNEMNRRITIILEFNEDWSGYKDVADELILEDSGIYKGLKDGVKVFIEEQIKLKK